MITSNKLELLNFFAFFSYKFTSYFEKTNLYNKLPSKSFHHS